MHTHQHNDAGPLLQTLLAAFQENRGVGDVVSHLARTYLDADSQAQLQAVLGAPALTAPVDAHYEEIEPQDAADSSGAATAQQAHGDDHGDASALLEELDLYRAALGVCPVCLDEDDDCEQCGGDMIEPDATLFLEMAMPAALSLPASVRRRIVNILASSLSDSAMDSLQRRR